MSGYFPYVSAAERRRRAAVEIATLRAEGRVLAPVCIEGRTITRTFWGKAWCEHLESYSDFESRLARGRSYARNGSVLDLAIGKDRVDALVRGTELYTVRIEVEQLARRLWQTVVEDCAGQVASLVELLEGKLSRAVMGIVTDKERGIFPSPAQITLACSCPDYASMCKHVAAALYGVGARLDQQPELLFVLRGVDPAELLARSVGRAGAKASSRRSARLPDAALAGIFGIELVDQLPTAPAAKRRGVRK